MTQIFKYITCFTLIIITISMIALGSAYFYLSPQLPAVDTLSDIQLQTPLRIYSNDGRLIGEFGDKRRTPINYEDIPQSFIQAFLAAEDDQFFQHHGITIKGIGRAVYQRLTRSSTQTGGSTITMQVAKNYFLTPEKKIIRKVKEIFLALQIEQILSKQQILELYVNKIFLGSRAYGIVAASQVYYGKPTNELSLAQMAMIAGLPKAPSAYNPLVNPDRALIRRDWILQRMQGLNYISQEDYQAAIAEEISAVKHQISIDIDAPYIAEMARAKTLKLLGKDAYTGGYRVITTINSYLQQTAQQAVNNGLNQYDSRHGFRGSEAHIEEITDENKKQVFKKTYAIAGLAPAIVIEVTRQSIKAELSDASIIDIPWENGLSTARPYQTEDRLGPKPKQASDILQIGDIIRVRENPETGWSLGQLPKAEAALISLNPIDGAILSLVGGYNFNRSKFNRATQAQRQIGSNIKPFIYSAALSNGFTAATTINDAPVVFDDVKLEAVWRPKNAGEFYGPTRLRKALYFSRNLVSIRILRQLGVKTTINYLEPFGFTREKLPRDLSLALGSPVFTPLEVATAYATFANGGFKIEPYLIAEIHNNNDELIYQASPLIACNQCEDEITKTEQENIEHDEEIIAEASSIEELTAEEEAPAINKATRIMDEKTLFIMDSILQDVVRKGTAPQAYRALKRRDIAGKTGTTNGPTDAWFSGYNANIVTTTWLGFDNNSRIGRREYGSSAALPIWIEFMQKALKGQPEIIKQPPTGLVSLLIDKETGKRAQPGQENTMFEYIQEELLHTIKSEQQKGQVNPVDIQDIF